MSGVTPAARSLRGIVARVRQQFAGPATRAIVANSGWLFADKGLRAIVGAITGIWLTRYLGPERFGELSYAMAFAALFGTLSALGTDAIVVRDLVSTPEQADEIIGSAVVARSLGAGLAIGALLLALGTVDTQPKEVRVATAAIACGLVFQPFEVAELWFQAQVKSRVTVVGRNAAFLVASAMKVWMILAKAGIVAFAAVMTAEALLSAVALVIAYQKWGRSWLRVAPTRARVVALLREGWPLLLSGVAIMVYVRIDQLMLVAMRGPREAGLYAAATRLSEIWYIIPMVIARSATPAIVAARQVSNAQYEARLGRLFQLLARVAYGVAIPMTAFSGPLVGVVYGDAYRGAGAVLAVHIWAALFVFVGVVRSIYTVAEGLNRVTLFGTILGAVINVGMNLVLIPAYGAIGAAVATMVSYGLADIAFYRFVPSCRTVYRMMTAAVSMNVVK